MNEPDFESEQEERAGAAAPLHRDRRVRWIAISAAVVALVAISLGFIIGMAPPAGETPPIDPAEQAEQADQEEPPPPPLEIPTATPAPLGDEAVATDAAAVSV